MPFLPQEISDHPSLIGIVRIPSCTYQSDRMNIPYITEDIDGNFTSMLLNVEMATSITGSIKTGVGITIPKENVTDFYPYTYYVLTDGEAEPLIMYPQYMASPMIIGGKFALSNQPIERYYPIGYRGDTTGRVYNITNMNQMTLPCATNEGLSYLNANANTIAQSRKSQITGNVLNAVGSVVSAVANPMTIGYGVSSIVNGINSIKEMDARNKDSILTPPTISSFGTPSTRKSFNTDNVRLIRYSITSRMRNKIENYIERYGNKYNNYATINLRDYKGYIKFVSPKVESEIDNMYLQKIIDILERGVYCE